MGILRVLQGQISLVGIWDYRGWWGAGMRHKAWGKGTKTPAGEESGQLVSLQKQRAITHQGNEEGGSLQGCSGLWYRDRGAWG